MIGPGGPNECRGRKRPACPRESASGTTPPRPAGELVRPRAAGDDDDLRGGARAVAEPEVPAATVGSQARHARAEAKRRAVPLGGAQEAVGDEQRLGVAARRLVAADREIVDRQARLELENAAGVAQLCLDAARAHRLVDAADGALALGVPDDEVPALHIPRLESGARLHVGEELAAELRHVDDRRIGIVLAAHAGGGARGPSRRARLLEHDRTQSALREEVRDRGARRAGADHGNVVGAHGGIIPG